MLDYLRSALRRTSINPNPNNMTTKNKDKVAKTSEETNVAPYVDYGTDYDQGTDTDASEVSLPFLKILQTQSKEIHPKNTLEEGAKAGRILNTGSMELTGDTVHFVPAIRQRKFVEWRDRDDGGGIVGSYDPEDDVVVEAIANAEEFGKYKTKAGNKLAETFYVFGIVADADGTPACMAVVAFASTQIKVWKKAIKRRMDTIMVPAGNNRKRKPPIFSHQLLLSTRPETNGKDHWFGWNARFVVGDNVKASLLTPDNPLFIAAKELREQVVGGTAVVDEAAADSGASAGDEEAF